ncbi:hypothetical protein [Caulobacter rhizosphaerae]|uniref:hypothetical protein n=1 Tax=Caulobacter rhizosphaerae TaxID=2010972 RepID=UPI0013D28C41|nr:hypothetical protein [Caulobacter rhizosphaerae]GGL35976.1 hypothetical protein GCM10010983_36290 [Caulobacter rhizosphaerae]
MSGEDPNTVAPPVVRPDGRDPWQWETKYAEVATQIWREAKILGTYLAVFGTLTLLVFALVADPAYPAGSSAQNAVFYLRRHDLLVFFVGSVGAVTFAIKWLVHSVAKGLWHQDRFLWRIFVPLTGGIYALVVLGLVQAGLMGGQKAADANVTSLTRDLVLAFLAGYFADGVSGLLSNVANAIFGQVDKK